MATGRYRFPKSARLLNSPDFAVVQRRGRRIGGRFLVSIVRARDPGPSRFGLAVSRKVGNAVVRNRVKRRLREAVRHLRVALDGVDVVLIALPSAADASFTDLESEVGRVVEMYS